MRYPEWAFYGPFHPWRGPGSLTVGYPQGSPTSVAPECLIESQSRTKDSFFLDAPLDCLILSLNSNFFSRTSLSRWE